MAGINNKPESSHLQEARPQGTIPRLRSDELLRGYRRLIIEHGGEDYCLRLTRNERLILTKD